MSGQNVLGKCRDMSETRHFLEKNEKFVFRRRMQLRRHGNIQQDHWLKSCVLKAIYFYYYVD